MELKTPTGRTYEKEVARTGPVTAFEAMLIPDASTWIPACGSLRRKLLGTEIEAEKFATIILSVIKSKFVDDGNQEARIGSKPNESNPVTVSFSLSKSR